VTRAAITVEWLKLRRSRLAWSAAALVGLGVPLLTAGFVAAAWAGPADAPLAVKVDAMVVGEGWSAYLGLLAQVLSVAMPLGAGIVASWCFGREFIDHTVSGLFAMPTSRSTIAAAKFVVTVAWSVAVGLVTVLAALLASAALDLPALSADVAQSAMKVLAIALGGGLLALPFAFVASAARGYLPAVSGLILMAVATQVLSVVGLGAWFPYSSVSLWAGMGGAEAAALIRPHHLALVPLAGAVGVVSTLWRWRTMEVV
jgi:ABC-2 type transport system permease protein